MRTFRLLTAVEQLAGHLREEIRNGALSGEMPGVNQLATRMGCSARTVQAAVKQLESEGLLRGQGAGRRSRIELPDHFAPPVLRVKILLYERGGEREEYILKLRHQLSEAGHTVEIAAKSLLDLGMDVRRVERFAESTETDAWIVVAASREVLEWFAGQSVPAFALFGRQTSVDIAGTGPRKTQAVAAAVRRLTELGHSRIVYLTREERRKPDPGESERVFLKELKNQGIAVGPYNLPDWEDHPKGFLRCLTSLFETTPPTALIASEVNLFTAAQQFLLQKGLRVPEDVSMVCNDPNTTFAWCNPSISHFDSDNDFWLRHLVRWVNGVARGKNDRRKVFKQARFVEGGTIAQAAPIRM